MTQQHNTNYLIFGVQFLLTTLLMYYLFLTVIGGPRLEGHLRIHDGLHSQLVEGLRFVVGRVSAQTPLDDLLHEVVVRLLGTAQLLRLHLDRLQMCKIKICEAGFVFAKELNRHEQRTQIQSTPIDGSVVGPINT